MKNLKKISRQNLKDVFGGKLNPNTGSVDGSCTRCVRCANGMNSCATDTIGNCDCAQSLAQSMC